MPFDPDEVCGTKREHHVGGTIASVRVRGSIRKDDGGWSLSVSLCDRPIATGDVVNAVISPEGPQRWDLEPDLRGRSRRAPMLEHSSTRCLSSTGKGYFRWIDAAKRRPDVRAERIAEVIRLLNAGVRNAPGHDRPGLKPAPPTTRKFADQ